MIMASPITFESLPAELIESIAELCEPEDLLELRQTSRYVEKSIRRTFARAFFSEHTLLLTEQYLRHAIRIAKDPILGKAIKTLRICIDEIDQGDDVYEEESKEVEYFSPPLSKELHRARIEQETIWETNLDATLLNTLVEILSALRLEKIVIFSGWVASGHRAPLHDEFNHGLELPLPHNPRPVSIILSALTSNKSFIKTIETKFPGWNSGAIRIQDMDLSLYAPKLQHLETLHISTWSDIYGEKGVKAFFQILATLPSLKILEVHHKHHLHRCAWQTKYLQYTCDQFITENIFTQSFPALKCLRLLGSMRVWFDEMIPFLQRAVATSGFETLEGGGIALLGRLEYEDERPEGEDAEAAISRLTGVAYVAFKVLEGHMNGEVPLSM